ncbi:unnamed protein product, partial [Heterosigma akashiwo]
GTSTECVTSNSGDMSKCHGIGVEFKTGGADRGINLWLDGETVDSLNGAANVDLFYGHWSNVTVRFIAHTSYSGEVVVSLADHGQLLSTDYNVTDMLSNTFDNKINFYAINPNASCIDTHRFTNIAFNTTKNICAFITPAPTASRAPPPPP